MLSSRKLAIFCILIASVQLIRCTRGSMTDQELECYKQLVKSFGKIVCKANLPEYVTVAYKSTDLLEKLSPEFQLKCVNTWNQGMRQAIWEIVSKSLAEAEDEIMYKAFDTVIRQSVKALQKVSKKQSYILNWQFELMLDDGNILEFLAFREQFPNENKEKIQNEKDKLMKEYKGMERAVAELCAIVHNYDSGILGEKCLGGETSKSSKPPGTYKSIMDRFNEFKTLVEQVNKDETWPEGIAKYVKIDELDKVEHEFKLECLMRFRLELLDKKQREQYHEDKILEYAYSALDLACQFFIAGIRSRIHTHRHEIVRQFESKFKKEEIISFLVLENNPDDLRKIFEIKRLRSAYGEDIMTEKEAKLWVNLYRFNKDIIGKYYDGPPREPTPKSRSILGCLNPNPTD